MVKGTKAAGMAVAALALSACGGGEWVKNEQHSTAYYQRLARCQLMASQSGTPEAVDVCMRSTASSSAPGQQTAERNTDGGYQRIASTPHDTGQDDANTSPRISAPAPTTDTGDVDQTVRHSQASISQDQPSSTGDNVTQSDVTTSDSEASTQPAEDTHDQDSSSLGIFPAIGHFIAKQAGNLKDSAMAAFSAGSDAGGSVAKGAGDAGKAVTEGAGDTVEGSDTQEGAGGAAGSGDEVDGRTEPTTGSRDAAATKPDSAGAVQPASSSQGTKGMVSSDSVSNQGVTSSVQQAGWLEKGNGVSL